MNTTSPTDTPDLPELTDEAIARMEREVFTAIRSERDTSAHRRSRRRRTTWWTVGSAAAVVLVAAVIAPNVQGLVSGSSGGAVSLTDSAVAPIPVPESAADGGARSGEFSATSGALSTDLTEQSAVREIVTTARASVEVADAEIAAAAIGADAVARGGYVESMTISGSGVVSQEQTVDGGWVIDPSMPYAGGNWITVRVPSADLSDAVAALADLGDVQSSAIDRTDVTEQAVDLRARISAAEASVDRLTELMGQAGSVADLIAAEQALSQRQADLESYQQQLTSIESQVSLSTLTVSLTEPVAAVKADPAGFGDGLAAGWNGLLATLNGIVIALGFLLPWLVIAGIVLLIVRGILRVMKRRREGRSESQ